MGNRIYSGSDTYRMIDPLLRSRSRELLIITPYIDLFYAKRLIGESSRKRIYLVTSPASNNSAAIKALSSPSIFAYLKALGYFVLLAAIFWYTHLYLLVPFAVLGCLITILLAYLRRRSTRSNLRIKVTSGRLVHEKLYLSDREVITGSANLTYAGTHRNLEHVELSDDVEKVAEIRKHFYKVWNS